MNMNILIKSYWCLTLSIIFMLVAQMRYIQYGYDGCVLLFIALAIICGGIYFFRRVDISIKFIKNDFWWMFAVLAIVAPIYLYNIFSIPSQINTDEITIMNISKQLSQQPNVDILGVSHYLGFTTFIFYIFGKLSSFLGGIDLYHFRLVHALFGIGISVAAYGFFRQLVNKRWQAFGLALWLSGNHALFAISRMAMRDNTGLLIELLTLMFLIYGWKTNRNFWLFLGGVIGALSFYTYFPSRVTMGIWFIFIAASVLFLRHPATWKEGGKRLLISLFGFLLLVPFMLISSAQHPDLAFNYSRQQFLFYPEGRELQQGWVSAATSMDGWIINIKNGLSTFNNHVHDLGYIYPNYGHGFVDPLTGVLLWIGIAVILWRWIKYRTTTLAEILCLIGFNSLYFAFAFLITKAPNYTRLFVILPFVIYLAGQGASFSAWCFIKLIKKIPRFAKLPAWSEVGIIIGILISVITWNGFIFKDFIRAGLVEGNDVGSTARYVFAHKEEVGHHWILAASKSYSYYYWGDEYQWKEWFGFFAGSDQTTQVVAPNEVNSLKVNKPFTILLTQNAWQLISLEFTKLHPDLRINKITLDGRLLAVEIS